MRPLFRIDSKKVHLGFGFTHGRGLWWTFIGGLFSAGILIVAIVQNSHRVRLRFLAWHLNVSLIVVVLTTALIAVVLDEVGGLVWRQRRRARVSRHSELEELRTQGREPTLVSSDGPKR